MVDQIYGTIGETAETVVVFTVSANACVKITDDGCLPLFINDVQCTIAI